MICIGDLGNMVCVCGGFGCVNFLSILLLILDVVLLVKELDEWGDFNYVSFREEFLIVLLCVLLSRIWGWFLVRIYGDGFN